MKETLPQKISFIEELLLKDINPRVAHAEELARVQEEVEVELLQSNILKYKK